MIDMPWRTLLSPEFRKQLPEKSSLPLFFADTGIFFKRSVGLVERSLHAEKQINAFIAFDRTPTCNRQTQTQQTDRQTDRQTDTGTGP